MFDLQIEETPTLQQIRVYLWTQTEQGVERNV